MNFYCFLIISKSGYVRVTFLANCWIRHKPVGLQEYDHISAENENDIVNNEKKLVNFKNKAQVLRKNNNSKKGDGFVVPLPEQNNIFVNMPMTSDSFNHADTIILNTPITMNYTSKRRKIKT